jgi:hypothetical protein
MATNSPFEVLVAALADFEEHGTREEKKSAILPLQREAKKLEIRSLELQVQRWMLTAAEIAGAKDTLRALAEFSQHDEIREWAAEILNLKQQPRTLPNQTLQI